MSRKLIRECLIRIKLFPAIAVLALIVWSYYAFIFCYFLGDFKGSSYQVSLFLIYHSTYVLLFWCFIKTMNSQVCRPPNQFYLTMARDQLIKECLSKEDKNRILTNSILGLPVMMRCFDGGVRYCGKCRCLKPDRAHHCSLCQTCVLKMDHHCPWVNNCIGFANYKFFVLFLFYAFSYCIFLCFILTPDVREFIGAHSNDYHHPSPPSKHVVVLWICSTLFTLGLGTLLLLHFCLLISNQTTIEIFQTPVFACGPLKRVYNLGPRTNFLQVFGHVKKLWLLPIYTSNGDGVNYPIREMYKSMLERYSMALRQGFAEEGLSI